jgi:hypothetical protein
MTPMTPIEQQVEDRWPGVLTEAQRSAVALLETGYSTRRGAMALDISVSAYATACSPPSARSPRPCGLWS